MSMPTFTKKPRTPEQQAKIDAMRQEYQGSENPNMRYINPAVGLLTEPTMGDENTPVQWGGPTGKKGLFGMLGAFGGQLAKGNEMATQLQNDALSWAGRQAGPAVGQFLMGEDSPSWLNNLGKPSTQIPPEPQATQAQPVQAQSQAPVDPWTQDYQDQVQQPQPQQQPAQAPQTPQAPNNSAVTSRQQWLQDFHSGQADPNARFAPVVGSGGGGGGNNGMVGGTTDLANQIAAIRGQSPTASAPMQVPPRANFPSIGGINPNPLIDYIMQHNQGVQAHDQRMAGMAEQNQGIQQLVQQELAKYLPMEHQLGIASSLAGLRTSGLQQAGLAQGLTDSPQTQTLKSLEILSNIYPRTPEIDQMIARLVGSLGGGMGMGGGGGQGEGQSPTTPTTPQTQQASFPRTFAHSAGATAAGMGAARGASALAPKIFSLMSKAPLPPYIKWPVSIAAFLAGMSGAGKVGEAIDPEYGKMTPNTAGNISGSIVGAGLGALKLPSGAPVQAQQQGQGQPQSKYWNYEGVAAPTPQPRKLIGWNPPPAPSGSWTTKSGKTGPALSGPTPPSTGGATAGTTGLGQWGTRTAPNTPPPSSPSTPAPTSSQPKTTTGGIGTTPAEVVDPNPNVNASIPRAVNPAELQARLMANSPSQPAAAVAAQAQAPAQAQLPLPGVSTTPATSPTPTPTPSTAGAAFPPGTDPAIMAQLKAYLTGKSNVMPATPTTAQVKPKKVATGVGAIGTVKAEAKPKAKAKPTPEPPKAKPSKVSTGIRSTPTPAPAKPTKPVQSPKAKAEQSTTGRREKPLLRGKAATSVWKDTAKNLWDGAKPAYQERYVGEHPELIGKFFDNLSATEQRLIAKNMGLLR